MLDSHVKRLSLSLCAVLSLSLLLQAADDSRQRTVEALKQALQADPQNAELWIHLGFAHRKVEQLDAAREAFEKAISISPQNGDALFMLGLIYEKQNRKADALRAWKQYLNSSPTPEKRAMAESHIHQLSQ